MEGSLSHLSVLFLRSRSGGAVSGATRALAASVMDHDVFAGVVDELIVVAKAQAVAGGRIQPVRRGVGAMVACEDHAVQRLVKVEIHLELEAPYGRGRVILVRVVDVEAQRRLVRGRVRVLFARVMSSGHVIKPWKVTD